MNKSWSNLIIKNKDKNTFRVDYYSCYGYLLYTTVLFKHSTYGNTKKNFDC